MQNLTRATLVSVVGSLESWIRIGDAEFWRTVKAVSCSTRDNAGASSPPLGPPPPLDDLPCKAMISAGLDNAVTIS